MIVRPFGTSQPQARLLSAAAVFRTEANCVAMGDVSIARMVGGARTQDVQRATDWSVRGLGMISTTHGLIKESHAVGSEETGNGRIKYRF